MHSTWYFHTQNMLCMFRPSRRSGMDAKLRVLTAGRGLLRSIFMKNIKLVFGILISVVFLYLAFRNVDPGQIIETFRSVNLFLVAGALALSILVLYVRALRWKRILGDSSSHMRVSSFFEALCVGQMANNLLPFRVGDITQGYFLGYKEKASKSFTFSTVIMERLFDLFPPLGLIMLGSFFVFLPEQFNALKLLLVFSIPLFVIFLALKSRSTVHKIVAFVIPSENLRGKITGLFENFYNGMKIIKNPAAALVIAAMTLLVWAIYGLMVFLCMRAFGIELGLPEAFLVMAIISMSVVIPSSPGYVGTWELCAKLGLGIFKISPEIAISFALGYHLLSWLPVVILGLFFMFKNGVSLSKIQEQ